MQTEQTQAVSRRAIAKGVAWSVPSLAVVGAAPATAASPTPELSTYVIFSQEHQSNSEFPYSCGTSGTQQMDVNGQNFILKGVSPGASLTGITTTFWLAVDAGTTWSTVGSTCWTRPTSTGQTATVNGVLFRAYTSAFTCSATVAANGTYTMPSAQMLRFRSSCQSFTNPKTFTYHYTQTVTLPSGTVVTKDNGWSNVMT